MVSLPSPITPLRHPLLNERGVQLYVKRDDLIHPEIMGNKWRKLKYNLEQAKKEGKNTILTLGGAYSNHIYATAAAGEAYGFKTIGIIRGNELTPDSNPTLQFAASKNMHLEFVDRTNFRAFRQDSQLLAKKYPDTYFLPEGGTNALAVQGCAEIIDEIDVDFDLIATPIGTGSTFCGLVAGVKESQKVLGISALKGSFVKEEMKSLLTSFQLPSSPHQVNTEYHFGGYGKTTSELINFMNDFKHDFQIQLDPIYTGKSFFGVWDMIRSYKFERNLRIVLLHTGGLQGISGFNRKKGQIIS